MMILSQVGARDFHFFDSGYVDFLLPFWSRCDGVVPGPCNVNGFWSMV